MPSGDSSVTEQLKALAKLQHIDGRIDQLEQLQGDLPEYIEDLENERKGLTTRMEKYAAEKAESAAERKRTEAATKDSEGAIKRYEEQQLQVRNNREYDALTKEIEAQKQRMEDMAKMVESLEARDQANQLSKEEAQARAKELDKVIKAKKKELDVVTADTASEKGKLEKTKAKAAKEVEARYFTAYERLRNRLKDGRAVVPLERGAAGGFAVPPQRQVEIRQRDKIVVCEHTGRIIVDKEMYDQIGAKLKF